MFKKLLFIALTFLVSIQAHAVIVNGSLTGPIGNNLIPTGWSNVVTGLTVLSTPDTNDVNNNVGLPIASCFNSCFGATPSASPDGGTWVGIGNQANIGWREEFGQSMTGLSVGTSYDISWFESNFGSDLGDGFRYLQPGQIEVRIDSASIGTGALLALGPGWFPATLSFMAISDTHFLSFTLAGAGPSYLGIDGISMGSLSVIPIPAAFWLFGTALIGFVGMSRRTKV